MNNIKKVIYDKGLLKNHIARKMGIVPSNISNWISGERTPSKPRIKMLCKILGCKEKDLYPEGIKNG